MEKDTELNDIQKNEDSLEHEPENESEYLSRWEGAELAIEASCSQKHHEYSDFNDNLKMGNAHGSAVVSTEQESDYLIHCKYLQPKDNRIAGSDQEVCGSLLNKLPMLKSNLLNDSEELNKKKRKIHCTKPKIKKRVIKRKENELKKILCPYMIVNSKRQRKLCLPGDGREHGIVFACLYRLLQCHFTLAPNTNDLNEDKCEELGIPYENFLPFIELMNIIKDIPVPDIVSRTGQLHLLPPSLGSLVGYRGLDLHQDYLQTSSRQFETSQKNATITELDENEANAFEGPSEHSETVSNSVEVEEPITSGSKEPEDKSYPRHKLDEIPLGEKNADSLLLTRLMTLFFWPGIMSCMPVPDLTKEHQTPEAAGVCPESPLTKNKDKAPGKRQTKIKRKEMLQQLSLKRYGKSKALNKTIISTASVEDSNNTVGSTGANGEISEAAAMPSASTGPASEADKFIIPVSPAKKAKRTPAKPKDVPLSDRVTRNLKKTVNRYLIGISCIEVWLLFDLEIFVFMMCS